MEKICVFAHCLIVEFSACALVTCDYPSVAELAGRSARRAGGTARSVRARKDTSVVPLHRGLRGRPVARLGGLQEPFWTESHRRPVLGPLARLEDDRAVGSGCTLGVCMQYAF